MKNTAWICLALCCTFLSMFLFSMGNLGLLPSVVLALAVTAGIGLLCLIQFRWLEAGEKRSFIPDVNTILAMSPGDIMLRLLVLGLLWILATLLNLDVSGIISALFCLALFILIGIWIIAGLRVVQYLGILLKKTEPEGH